MNHIPFDWIFVRRILEETRQTILAQTKECCVMCSNNIYVVETWIDYTDTTQLPVVFGDLVLAANPTKYQQVSEIGKRQ